MKSGPKHGNILGIKVLSTQKDLLLTKIALKLSQRERFYIVTTNPEIVLAASKDWLLKKTIERTDFSVPDGIGLKFAYKFLHNLPLTIIKGRELFIDILNILNNQGMRVYLFGGAEGEGEKALQKLKERYQKITFKTNLKFPKYSLNGQPNTADDRKLHKTIMGNIKLFEPDFIFVAMTPPKQEKWIYRNFFRTNAIGAMGVGGTYRYYLGLSPLPPKWMANFGLEWFWRLITEPRRVLRIAKAIIIFPCKVFLSKFFK